MHSFESSLFSCIMDLQSVTGEEFSSERLENCCAMLFIVFLLIILAIDSWQLWLDWLWALFIVVQYVMSSYFVWSMQDKLKMKKKRRKIQYHPKQGPKIGVLNFKRNGKLTIRIRVIRHTQSMLLLLTESYYWKLLLNLFFILKSKHISKHTHYQITLVYIIKKNKHGDISRLK